jgi:hypothetical protein
MLEKVGGNPVHSVHPVGRRLTDGRSRGAGVLRVRILVTGPGVVERRL